jgi:hypothetical protein
MSGEWHEPTGGFDDPESDPVEWVAGLIGLALVAMVVAFLWAVMR